MAAAILRVLTQQEASDCGVVALAMYLGLEYTDVLRAVTIADRRQGKLGLWTKTMQRVAARLGHPLRMRKQIDVEADYGILRLPEHCVVLRNGLAFDNGLVWDLDAYLSDQGVTLHDCQILVTHDNA